VFRTILTINIISLYSSTRLVFVMDTQCVFCEVENIYLHTVHNKRMVLVTAAVPFFVGH